MNLACVVWVKAPGHNSCAVFRVGTSRGVTAWHMVRDKLMLGPIMSREMSQSQPGIYNSLCTCVESFSQFWLAWNESDSVLIGWQSLYIQSHLRVTDKQNQNDQNIHLQKCECEAFVYLWLKISILSPALPWLFGLIVLEWWFREEQGANISNCNNNSCPGPISIIRPIQETNEKQRDRVWESVTISQWEARIVFNGPIRKQEMPVKNKGSNTGGSRTRYKKWYKDIY